MADQQCPLAPNVIDRHPFKAKMNLAHVKEIEQHVLSAGPCIHPPLKDVILHGSFDGSTPLLLACEEGHIDAVERIVDWGTDVNAAANYYQCNGGKIEGATAIFVAALQGNSDIVKYLISKGADVSAFTSTDSYPVFAGATPLHAALMWCPFYDLSFYEECVAGNIIVRILLDAGADPSTPTLDGTPPTPVWMMQYCGVDATIALVNHGLDLNHRNLEGKTILHFWSQSDEAFTDEQGRLKITEEERFKVVSLLVDRGADLTAEDNAGFRPILTSANSYTCDVFDLLFEKDVLDRRQQIDALELAGSYLLLATDPYYQEKGCAFWRQASQLREESPPISKQPLPISSGRIVEWATPEGLERVIEDPSEYWIQCIFTRFRIYSGMRTLEAVSHSLPEYFKHVAYYIDPDEYVEGGGIIPNPEEHSDQDLATVLWGYLETILLFDPLDAQDPNIPLHIFYAVTELINALSRLLPNHPLRNTENIQKVLDLIFAVYPNFSALSYDFFEVLTGLPLTLRPNIRELLSQSSRQNARTLISIACDKENWATLRILLHFGADPTTVGWFGLGNTALHVLAGMDETPARSAAANLLFYYGANPNQMNDEGETAVDIWRKKNCGEEDMQSAKWNDRPDWCRDKIPKLSRLGVKTIHINGVSFDEEHASLPPFQELPNSM